MSAGKASILQIVVLIICWIFYIFLCKICESTCMNNKQVLISTYIPQESTLSAEKSMLSRSFWHAAETKISAGLSRVTGPAELIEMAQYTQNYKRNLNIAQRSVLDSNEALTARACVPPEPHWWQGPDGTMSPLATCDNHYATELCKATIKNFSCNDSSAQDQFLYNMFPTAYLLASRFCCPFETLLRTFTQWQSTQGSHTPVPLGNVGKKEVLILLTMLLMVVVSGFPRAVMTLNVKVLSACFFPSSLYLIVTSSSCFEKGLSLWPLQKVVDLRSLYQLCLRKNL